MAKIFVNYRRDDSKADAREINRVLRWRFGNGNVFFDIRSLAKGGRFDIAIDQAVGRCDAMVVIIGPRWLTLATEDGRPRLHAKDDFTRYEIERALYYNKRILPVLLDDTPMPKADDLPETIRGLTRWNAAQVRHASSEADIDEIAQHLKAMMPRKGVSGALVTTIAMTTLLAGIGGGLALERGGVLGESGARKALQIENATLYEQLNELRVQQKKTQSEYEEMEKEIIEASKEIKQFKAAIANLKMHNLNLENKLSYYRDIVRKTSEIQEIDK